MANEAVLRDKLADPINFNCADDIALEKGAFVSLVEETLGGRRVSGAVTIADECAGIVAREKISGDGRLTVPVYRKGIFDVYCSGAIGIGAPVNLSLGNYVSGALIDGTSSSASGATIIGHMLEAASDAEVAQMELDL